MAERKFYGVKLNEYEAGALAFAGEVWPEHADNTTELFRQILADWLRIKKDAAEGGTRTQTLHALNQIRNDVSLLTNIVILLGDKVTTAEDTVIDLLKEAINHADIH